MSSKLTYSYPEWIHETRYPKGYNILALTHIMAEAAPKKTLCMFVQCGNTMFSQLKQFSLSLSAVVERWFYTLPRHSVAEWDTMANMFYQTFNTPHPIHLDARTWNEGRSNKEVLLPFQTLLRASADDLINTLLETMRPRNLYPEEVYITPFSPEYCLPTFII